MVSESAQERTLIRCNFCTVSSGGCRFGQRSEILVFSGQDPLKVWTHRTNPTLPQVHATIDRWSRDVCEGFFTLRPEYKEIKTKAKTKKKERIVINNNVQYIYIYDEDICDIFNLNIAWKEVIRACLHDCTFSCPYRRLSVSSEF